MKRFTVGAHHIMGWKIGYTHGVLLANADSARRVAICTDRWTFGQTLAVVEQSIRNTQRCGTMTMPS